MAVLDINKDAIEDRFTQFDIQLNEESGEFYYKSDRFEIVKVGKEPWNYLINLDGREVKQVTGVDISLIVGQSPIISMEVADR